jgi:acyl dehydratase
MGVDPALAGRSFPRTPPLAVTGARIAQFVEAIGLSGPIDSEAVSDEGGGRPVVAPPTFAIVVAFAAVRSLLDDPDSGLSLRRVVHGDQRFVYRRPIRAGDSLCSQLHVQSVRSLGGADIISTCSEISTEQGELVCTAYATLVHRGEGPAQ